MLERHLGACAGPGAAAGGGEDRPDAGARTSPRRVEALGRGGGGVLSGRARRWAVCHAGARRRRYARCQPQHRADGQQVRPRPVCTRVQPGRPVRTRRSGTAQSVPADGGGRDRRRNADRWLSIGRYELRPRDGRGRQGRCASARPAGCGRGKRPDGLRHGSCGPCSGAGGGSGAGGLCLCRGCQRRQGDADPADQRPGAGPFRRGAGQPADQRSEHSGGLQ